MLNPVKEAIYSATYVDNYIDSVENLPDDVQRHLSRIRDIDVQYRNLLRNVDHYYDLWCTLKSSTETSSNRRSRAITRMQQTLIQAQELGDEKMKIVNQLQELIAQKTRQLDTDQKNLDIKEELQAQQQLQAHYNNDQIMDDANGGANGLSSSNQKRSRTQSPARDIVGLNNSNGNNVGACYERALSNSKDSYGNFVGNVGNTQDQSGGLERSISNGSGIVSSGSGNALNVGGGNLTNSDQIRAGGKRARRRNDTLNMNMEMGNDSNSPNETGSNSTDRNPIQGRASNINSNVNQKKSISQNQGSLSGNNGNVSGQSTLGNVTSNSGKKKKRKTRGAHAASAQISVREEDPQETIDPDEPTYCVCNQISFGEMILCDNDLCPIEWFHFSCVSLILKPKGRWYCPNCRGDRPNVMKPKAQFLKELERYNKEKEEKT